MENPGINYIFIQLKIPLNYSPRNLYLWIEAAMPQEQRLEFITVRITQTMGKEFMQHNFFFQAD